MRPSRTLSLSLAREIVQYALLGFAAIALVLLSQNLLRRLDDLAVVGFTGDDLLVVLRCLLAMLAANAVPVSLLFGVLLAVRRRLVDGEVLAMRACGMGLGSFLWPSLALGALVSLGSGWLLLVAEHESRRELLALFKSVAARGSILTPGEFRGIGHRVIYVNHRDRENRLEGIMISDRSGSEPFVVFAESGRLSFEEETASIRLELSEGELHLRPATPEADDPEDRYRRVLFRSFDYVVDVRGLVSGDASPVRPKQMNLAELRRVVARANAGEELWDLDQKDPTAYRLEIQRRFALPVVPLLFAWMAVPLGLLGTSRSRAWGPLLCAAVALGYYVMLTFCELLARQGWLPAEAAPWLPNALLAGVAIALVRRSDGRLTA